MLEGRERVPPNGAFAPPVAFFPALVGGAHGYPGKAVGMRDMLCGALGALLMDQVKVSQRRLLQHPAGLAIAQAGNAAIEYAFAVLHADEIISLIRPANTGSIRVAERLGATYQRDVELLGQVVRVYSKLRPPGEA